MEIVITIFVLGLSLIGINLNRENGEQNEKITAINNLITEKDKNINQNVSDIKNSYLSQEDLLKQLIEKYNMIDKDITIINYILKFKKN